MDAELAKLEQILVSFLSEDNAARRPAEEAIYKAFDVTPDMIVFGLLKIVRTSPQEKLRSLAAVLLRKKLPNSEPIFFTTLKGELQASLKNEILQAVVGEPSGYVRGLLCDTIAELAQVLLQTAYGGWDQLLPFCAELCGHAEQSLRVNGFSLWGKLAEGCADVLTPHHAKMAALFEKGLKDPVLEVRGTAAETLLFTARHTETTQLAEPFRAFVPAIFQILAQALNADQETLARKILYALVELVTDDGKFMRPFLGEFTQAMCAIGGNKELDDGIRQLAMEAIVGLAEDAPALCRKNKAVIQGAVNLALALMLDVDDEEGWVSEDTHPDQFDVQNFDCGESSLDRLASAIRGDKLTPVVMPLIASFLGNSDWRYRHAGLRALAQIVEVIVFDKIPWKQLSGFLEDPHPRVRYGALHFFGQGAVDHAPRMQSEFHQELLPRFLRCLQEVDHSRIQVHAAAALFNFLDSWEDDAEELFPPYYEPLAATLLELLKHGKVTVKEQTMTTLGAMAHANKQLFLKFYSQVLPLMKEIIAKAASKELTLLRIKALEAATFIGMQVGVEVFRNDARDIVNMLASFMKEKALTDDDVARQYLLQAWIRLCDVLKAEFLPVVPYIIPVVFEAARKEPDWSLLKSRDEVGDDVQEMRMSNRAMTSALEDKAIGCSALCSLVHDLKEHFLPWIPETAEIMVPLMRFTLNDDVRSYAMTIQPDMILSIYRGVEQKKLDVSVLKSTFKKIVDFMIKECFPNETDNDMRLTLVGALHLMTKYVGALAAELLDAESLKVVGSSLFDMLIKSFERMQARETRKHTDEDMDEETEARLDELNAEEAELHFTIAECIGEFIKSCKTAFLPTFEKLLPEIIKLLNPKLPAGVRKTAIFIWDDIAEFLGEAAGPLYPVFMQPLLVFCNDPDAPLRQAAVYGIGVSAQFGGKFFKPFEDEAIKALLKGLRAEDARDEEYAEPTDNMIVALGKIAQHQGRNDLWPLWLSFLPLTADQGEAANTYGLLCSQIEANNTALLGQNFANLPKIVSVLGGIVGTVWCPEQIAPRVSAILLKICSGMPQEALQQLLATYGAEERKRIQEVLVELQKKAAASPASP